MGNAEGPFWCLFLLLAQSHSCSSYSAQGKLWQYLHQPLRCFFLISASPFSPVASSLPVPVDVSCLPSSPITSLSLPLLPCDCTSMVPVCGSPPLLRDEPQRSGQQFRVPCSTNGGQPVLGIQVSMCVLGSAWINRRGGAGGRSRLCLVVINKYIVLRLTFNAAENRQ